MAKDRLKILARRFAGFRCSRDCRPRTSKPCSRPACERVLVSDRTVQARIFRNVVDIVAEKIVQDNLRMRDHVRDKIAQERRVSEYQRRLELAVSILVDEAGWIVTRSRRGFWRPMARSG